MYKRFCKNFLCLCAALALLCGGLVFVVDPFYHYRTPEDYTEIIYFNPNNQNVGIVKNAAFDTLITGSSMMQNFRANWFDSALGCSAVNLSFQGESIDAYKTFFDASLEGNKIKTVFFGLDVYTVTGEVVTDVKIERYLSDSNPFNDVSYLFNKDVIFKYTREWFAYKHSDNYNFYEASSWDSLYDFSEKTALENYKRTAVQEDVKADNFFFENTEAVTKWLLDCTVNNPETEFVLFIPPYSILFWDNMVRKGSLDATIYSLKYAVNELLQCSNVRIFCFLNSQDVTTNLDLYKDYARYCSDVNRLMLECYTLGRYELTLRNADETLDGFKEFAACYDYGKLFSE